MSAAYLRALYERARNGSEHAAHQLANELEGVRRNLAREKLISFTRYTFEDYVTNWHHELIAEYLDRVALSQLQPGHQDAIKRLMIFVPPRHGKSELTSRRFPAFLLGKNPNLRVVAASYSADLARSMNRDTQRVIDSDSYQELFQHTCLSGIRVRTDHRGNFLRNADEFEVVGSRGGYKSVGVCGGITGRGFNVGIIDDPVKDRMEADSKVYRDRVMGWYTSTFYSRRDKANAAIVLIMTRWHQDDLAGRLLEQQRSGEGDEWTVLWLPALREHDAPFHVPIEDVDHREEGAALWPYLFDRDDLLSTMAKSVKDAASIYQQRPAPAEGALFNKAWELRFRREGDTLFHPDGRATTLRDCVRFTTNDLACSMKESADYTVISSWAWCRRLRHLFLLDVDRRHLGGHEHIPALRAAGRALDPCTHWVESAGFQLALVQLARSQGLAVRELKADTDKVSRALMATALMEEGGMSFPAAAPWLDNCLSELWGFPSSAHDDFVDTVSYAARVVSELQRGSVFGKATGGPLPGRYQDNVTSAVPRW